MTREEFLHQISRLKSTWPNSFPDEKVKLIWGGVNTQDKRWFEKLVTSLISGCVKSPVPQDFIIASNNEDKKNRKTYYEEHPIHAISMFTENQKKFLFSITKACVTGKIQKDEASIICQELDDIIKTHSKQRAHLFFEEISETHSLDYADGWDTVSI